VFGYVRQVRRTGFAQRALQSERNAASCSSNPHSEIRTPQLTMGFRHWLRQHLGGDEATGEDVPPNRSLMNAIWGRDEERLHALGEYSADTYPRDLAELLSRRQQVAEELMEIDITDPQERVAAIPRLREMLRTYPHPLVYETLIHAYVDADRYDEARGVVFAARERRLECMRSEYPEIRSEVDRLAEWTLDEVEELRQGRRGTAERTGREPDTPA
jgi:hypothetical protein